MKFVVRGGEPLRGEVRLSGAKNSASKLMVASLLTDEPCVLENFPKIGETDITAELCRKIGSRIEFSDSTLKIHTPEIKENKVSGLSRRNRIPILTLGPLLARVGRAEVPLLSGDKIGPRPVDLHITALETLGAKVETTPASYQAIAPSGLRGAVINFDPQRISVGATENAILSSVLASGNTIIFNAALEPEIMDIIKMLQKMGAIIELGAHRDVYIEGVSRLRGVTHRVIPDRNEAVSFACLAIATNGKIFVKEAIQDHLITFLNAVRRLGAEYQVGSGGITFWRTGSLKPLNIKTDVHPGFMTDWQQPMAVVLTQAGGESLIHETIYEDRFGYAEDLNAIGADIRVSVDCPDESWCRFAGKNFQHTALIRGPTKLRGGKFRVKDLRAGMVAVITALVGNGQSEIEGVEEIDRGYEKIDERLKALSADIERIV